MQLLFHRDTGIVSGIVKRFTRSPYSHVSVWFPDRMVGYESAPFHGVRRFLVRPGNVDAFQAPVDERAAVIFAEEQLGKGYDWGNVLRFAYFSAPQTRQSRKASNRWFCAELVEVICEQGGLDLLQGNPWEHSPRDLALSLKITPANL